MATVLKRTVYVEQDKNGYFRFQDWAITTTTLGTMAEPFSPDLRRAQGSPSVNFDPTDEMALITDVEHANSDLLPTMLSGGGPVTIGGNLRCRLGR